jgi:transposase
MIQPQFTGKVYLASGATDMRKAINGLSMLVEQAMDLDPFSGDLFVFCNRKRTIIKILYWHTNGFLPLAQALGKGSVQMAAKQLFEDETGPVMEPSATDTVTIAAHSRRPLPKYLPRVEVVHDIEEEDKVCVCGQRLSRICEDTCEKLDYIPAKVRVEYRNRPKYACKACEGVEDDGPR